MTPVVEAADRLRRLGIEARPEQIEMAASDARALVEDLSKWGDRDD